jgi:hypothetical protein
MQINSINYTEPLKIFQQFNPDIIQKYLKYNAELAQFSRAKLIQGGSLAF